MAWRLWRRCFSLHFPFPALLPVLRQHRPDPSHTHATLHSSNVLFPTTSTLQIDGLACPLCLESVPLVEADLFGQRCPSEPKIRRSPTPNPALPHPHDQHSRTRPRCARCFQCPCCGSYLQVALSEAEGTESFSLSCGHCFWNSKPCGLVAKEPQSLVLHRPSRCPQRCLLIPKA